MTDESEKPTAEHESIPRSVKNSGTDELENRMQRSIVEHGQNVMLDGLDEDELQCPECYRIFTVAVPDDVVQTFKTRYCPRCGSRL